MSSAVCSSSGKCSASGNSQIAVQQMAMSSLGRSKSVPAQNLTGLSAADPGASSPLEKDIGYVGRLVYRKSVPSAEMPPVGAVVFCGDSASNSLMQCSARSCFVPPMSGPPSEWCPEFHDALQKTAATLFGDKTVVVCPSAFEHTYASQLLYAALVKRLSGIEVENTLSEMGAWDGYFADDVSKVHQDVIPNQTLCFCKLFDLFLLVV